MEDNKNQENFMRTLAKDLTDVQKRLNDRPSGSGTTSTLPSNTIANPRGDVKAITTRSGVQYDGPTAPTTSSNFAPKVVYRDTEATKDKELPIDNGRAENIQPPVVQSSKGKEKVNVEQDVPIKANLPYPSRLDEQKHHEQNMHQMEKFYQIRSDMSFKISFTDATLLMPKF